jgi:uncharacterized membrane protein YjjP (DUF1212 family)
MNNHNNLTVTENQKEELTKLIELINKNGNDIDHMKTVFEEIRQRQKRHNKMMQGVIIAIIVLGIVITLLK